MARCCCLEAPSNEPRSSKSLSLARDYRVGARASAVIGQAIIGKESHYPMPVAAFFFVALPSIIERNPAAQPQFGLIGEEVLHAAYLQLRRRTLSERAPQRLSLRVRGQSEPI